MLQFCVRACVPHLVLFSQLPLSVFVRWLSTELQHILDEHIWREVFVFFKHMWQVTSHFVILAWTECCQWNAKRRKL